MVTYVTPYCAINGHDFSSIVYREGKDSSGGSAGVGEIQVPGRNYADVRDEGRMAKKYKIKVFSTDREVIEEFLKEVNTAPEDSEFYPFDAARFGLIASAYASASTKRWIDNTSVRVMYEAEAEITCREAWLCGPDAGITVAETYARRYHLQATSGGGSTLVASTLNESTWETFTIVDMGAGKIALKCYDGTHYVTATGGGGSTVDCSATSAGNNETFTPVSMGTDKYAFLCYDGSHYLSAAGGGGAGVTADAHAASYYETFIRVSMGGSNYAYRAWLVYEYASSALTNSSQERSPISYLAASGNYFALYGYNEDLSVRITVGSSEAEYDRYLLLCDKLLGSDLFEVGWRRKEAIHTWDADLTKTWANVSLDVHSKVSGGAISASILTLDNGDYIMIPFYGPLPVSGSNGAAKLDLTLSSAMTGDGATVQYAMETDLSDMAEVDHDDLVVGENTIYIPGLEGESHVAIGIKAAASGSVALSALKGTVKRYVAPSQLPWSDPDESFKIRVKCATGNGQLTSLVVEHNDRFWY